MRNLRDVIRKILFFNEAAKRADFSLNTPQKKNYSPENDNSKGKRDETIDKNIKIKLDYMKKKYSIPLNGDMILREFKININKKQVEAFILFFDGMVDTKIINDNILQPLMLLSKIEDTAVEDELIYSISKHLIPQNQLKITNKYMEMINQINFGGCGVFIDGTEYALAIDVKGWEHRGVERPNTELVIRGPQEGFNEVLRVNTALIRIILKDEDMIAEDISIGKRSHTACSMIYIKDIANDSLVDEVRRRLKSIEIDYLIDTGQLEQFLEDSTFLPAPQIIATERPDRTAALLAEGKVGVVINGSPFALIMPATFESLIHSTEDMYLRFPYANFLRFIRISGLFLSLLLPGIYIAITNFHQEMIPTDLLMAIEASREKVPFPSVFEIIIMELAFELIREAGIRIPGPIGPTLGIIGALILGQAAVAANIVSPIMIIVVAVTGIGSFAIPNFSLAFSFRILKFGYIFLGALSGFLGLTAGIFIHGLILANAKSFGVPFMINFGSMGKKVINDGITRAPLWKMDKRPEFLKTKDQVRQKKISRGWTKNKYKNIKQNKK